MNQVQVRERGTTSVNQTDGRVKAFRITVLVSLVLLVLQYILGIIANLEVSLPAGNAWRWVFQNSVLIQLHIYNGTLLIVAAVVALILSFVARHRAGMITALAGLALIVFSWLSGAEFLGSGDNGFSLRMGLGFMGAFIAYIVGYYLARPLTQKQSI